MKQYPREVRVCQLHGIIQSPKRGTKAVTHAQESSTRRGVRFEHQHFLTLALGIGGGVEIVIYDVLPSGMVKISREHLLWVPRSTRTVLRIAVVAWVADGMSLVLVNMN